MSVIASITAPAVVLVGDEWQRHEAEHEARADALTSVYRERHALGEKHAIDDFLFTYYSYKPAVLRKWHPGIGIALV